MIHPLTSLRFIFALMVFATHCTLVDDAFGSHLVQEGYVGVSFFFVLSGFIIACNYEQRLRERRVGKRAFWMARAARIYPLHWLTLLIAALWGLHATTQGGIVWLRHFLASFTLTNAYVPLPGYYFSFNSPSWSLCCEQLFYFSFPFLVPLLRSNRRLLAALAAAALLLLAGMHFTPGAYARDLWYVNPLARFPDFLVGMALFRLHRALQHRPPAPRRATLLEAGAVALFLLFYLCAAGVPQVYRYSCYYWLPVAAVISVFALNRGGLSRALSGRFMVLCGEISYGFYLLHMLVLEAYVRWTAATGLHLCWQLSVPLLLAATLLLSLLSYRFIEQPAKRIITARLAR